MNVPRGLALILGHAVPIGIAVVAVVMLIGIGFVLGIWFASRVARDDEEKVREGWVPREDTIVRM